MPYTPAPTISFTGNQTLDNVVVGQGGVFDVEGATTLTIGSNAQFTVAPFSLDAHDTEFQGSGSFVNYGTIQQDSTNYSGFWMPVNDGAIGIESGDFDNFGVIDGPGVPKRDLYLSPDHAVFVHDMLVPVKCLVEGVGIAQVPVDRVSYWHVELAHHAVLLAEGLAVESLLPGGDRLGFANSRIVALHPDSLALRWEGEGCAPLVVAAPKLQAIRSMLARRVQTSPTEQRRAR